MINIFFFFFVGGEIHNHDMDILDVLFLNNQMWSYIRSLKFYIGIIIEIIYVIIQTISHYIFSTTEKNIRNEIVLITGAGRGLGKINLISINQLLDY